MGNNELVLRRREELAVVKANYVQPQDISYSMVDANSYSFECVMRDNTLIRMFESDRVYEDNDFIDFEIEDEKEESNKDYYLFAAASGILTGTFSRLKITKDKLEFVKEWGDKDWEKIIISSAQMIGLNKADTKGAIAFLKKRFIPCFSEGLTEETKKSLDKHLKCLASHPSIAGLAFSIFTQFGGYRYSIEDDRIKTDKLPEYYAIGNNTTEKLIYGVLYWIFNLAVDVVISEKNILDDMKMPKQLIQLLKAVYKLPMFKVIPRDLVGCEKIFSEWLKKTFEKRNYKDEEGKEIKFDVNKIVADSIEKIEKAIKDSLPVILNESFVRAFYTVKKLAEEIKEKDIKSFDDLSKVDADKVLPINNRLLSRMVLISSASFTGVNITGAVFKAIKDNVTKGRGFRETLLEEINIPGIGRLILAAVADSQYWDDDVKVFLHRKDIRKKESDKNDDSIVEDIDAIDTSHYFELTPGQLRLQHSLQCIAVNKDIEHTSDDDKPMKELWCELWKEKIASGMGVDPERYFVADEKVIYDFINSLEQDEDNLRWFYLMAMEVIVFKPYHSLGLEFDKDFRKLERDKYNYIDDQFARRQTIINQPEIDSIREYYKKYKNIISGKNKNKLIAAGAVIATAATAGGLAFVFAPGIATMVAGEAVVGLHGAALTSASLAFVGGGSLAAGGLGMAGGTAIITGGGIILGLAGGSGGASMAILLSQTDNEFWLRQTTKWLVYCRCIIKDKFNNESVIKSLLAEIDSTLNKLENNIKELEDEDCSLDKDVIKKAKENHKYLTRCKNEMKKISE